HAAHSRHGNQLSTRNTRAQTRRDARAYDPRIHLLREKLFSKSVGVHRYSGLPELRIIMPARRVTPTCGVKPGHDGGASAPTLASRCPGPRASADTSARP